MKKFTLLLILLCIVILISCNNQTPLKPNIIQEASLKTYTIQTDNGVSQLREMQQKTKSSRLENLELERINEEVDACIDKITENWVRIIDHKLIRGYDEKLDWELRSNLKAKAMKGEKAC